MASITLSNPGASGKVAAYQDLVLLYELLLTLFDLLY